MSLAMYEVRDADTDEVIATSYLLAAAFRRGDQYAYVYPGVDYRVNYRLSRRPIARSVATRPLIVSKHPKQDVATVALHD